ncbi:lamin tail domain-containing protein, partial [Daejeonella sp.]|uniref:lamin tail domain-containing protein n=1 Tax=Daejeonella sp. TaxID=2805397 RepID=UPI003983701C
SVRIAGYDLVELKADSLKLMSDSTVKIYFNKHLNSATLIPDKFVLSPSNTVKKIVPDALFREVTLIYEKKFHSDTHHKLFLSRIKDCSGKSIIGSQLLEFKTSKPPPPIAQRIDTAEIIITEIFADPSPEVGLPLVEFIEIFNPGKDAADLNKWILSDGGTKAVIENLIIQPGEYVILAPMADTLLFRQFGKIKGISPWPSLGNAGDQITLKSFKRRLVDSVAFLDKWYKNKMKKNGGWSLEKAELLNHSCNGFYNWFSSIDPNGGTPGRGNSLKKAGNTQQKLRIDSISYSSDSTVTISLNSIADTTYYKPAHFKIDNKVGTAIAISVDETYMKIHLGFGPKFQEGISYVLSADSLFNCMGERAEQPNNQALFTVPINPELDYPVIINEIFADPSPQVGLPEAEYVELYNPTDKLVYLKGMSYGDEGIQYKFTSGEIAAQSFLILCADKEIANFSVFGKVLGLSVWPSLANDKDVLILKNNKGRQFHRVAYNSGWYRDKDKKSGGYSLEMISPISSCAGSQNWSASKDPAGGTPGKQNSIFNNSPGEALKLLEVVLKDSITLLLTFNKSVDSLSASAAGSYHINNGLGTPDQVLPISPAFEKVELKLKNPPTRGLINRIELKQISDCSGSHIAKDYNYGEFILAERILKNSVLVNEILFNPRTNGVDFIELYNNTKHLLDLADLAIATIGKDTIEVSRPISIKQFLLEPGQYIALTSAPEILKKEYKIENPDRILKALLPPFNNQKGTVVLLSNGNRIDELNFDEKLHFQLFKKFEGISLERSSIILKTNEAGNFRSATAASGFATPGYKNSQYSEGHFDTDEFKLVSRTFSPDNDGFEDLLQISYKMPAPGMVANVKIFNDKGILIKHILKNSTLNVNGLFVWDGLNDYAATAEIGIYFIYVEIFDPQGKVKRFRKPFALAYKL